jgi:hypothetical protein
MGQVVTQPDMSPRRVAACRTHLLHELTGADRLDTDGGRSNRTPDMDTGHWTSDIGHRTRGRADAGRVPDAEHWTGGRWTCGRGQGDQGAVGVRTSWYHDTAGQRTVLLWAAAAHAALGNHDGSAVRPPASARDCGLHCQASCWVAPPAAKRRLGALLSSDDFGSRVERQALGQVLWRAGLQGVGNVSGATVVNW